MAGRYAAIVTLGLIGAVVGSIASFAVMGIASAVELPGGLSEPLSLNGDRVCGMAFATAACVLIGATVASVVTPVYFKFGQTKATQLLPTIIVILFVAPFMILGNSGILSDDTSLRFISDLNAFVEEPTGLAITIVAIIAVSILLLVISAAVSLKLYGRREL